MIPSRRYNPKRRISLPTQETRNALAKRLIYVGSPYHKRLPGDYGLTPPSEPRPDTELCDGIDPPKVLKRSHAQKLLKAGVLRGLVSAQWRGDFPQNVWSIAEDGSALECQLDNEVRGTYHGYPMGMRDPFTKVVRARWEENK